MSVFPPKTWATSARQIFVIRYICWEGILSEKISLIGHYSLQHPPEWFTSVYRGLYFTTQITKKYCTAMCYYPRPPSLVMAIYIKHFSKRGFSFAAWYEHWRVQAHGASQLQITEFTLYIFWTFPSGSNKKTDILRSSSKQEEWWFFSWKKTIFFLCKIRFRTHIIIF